MSFYDAAVLIERYGSVICSMFSHVGYPVLFALLIHVQKKKIVKKVCVISVSMSGVGGCVG